MVPVTTLTPLDDRIIIWGMSCSGKTTFAKSVSELYGHTHHCFDFLFPWHLIETFGLSITEALRHVSNKCQGNFVLDGWHLADKNGKLLPKDAKVYVVYATYEQIIKQYRVPVDTSHLFMFKKWYGIDYAGLQARYFENTGQFVERTRDDFTSMLALHQ